MVTGEQIFAFGALVVVMVAVPGPSVLFTVSRALTVGRRDALLTVVGNAAGMYLQVVGVAFGLGVLIERSAAAYTVIKFIGAAYLVYLGVQAIRKRHALAGALAATVDGRRKRVLRALRDGAVVGFFNPKSIVFLAAVLPQFVNPAAGGLAQQMMLLGLLVPVIALVLDSGWALAAGTARDWFARTPRRLAAIGGTGGAAMIGLGAGLLLTGRRD